MAHELEEIAKQATIRILAGAKRSGDVRIEVIPNDLSLIVYCRTPHNHRPDEWIYKNAEHGKKPFAGPVVIDPETNMISYRYVIPYLLYNRFGVEETLQMVLTGKNQNGEIRMDWSKLRQSKGLPADCDEFSYGRSGRLRLVTDHWPALLTARLFPGELAEMNLVRSPECLSRVAGVLLARSGAPHRPHSFHMIGGTSFFSVERAIELYYLLPATRLKNMEKDLLEQAEEDRRVISALMHPDVPVSQLIGV
jgi:hypothetical protein